MVNAKLTDRFLPPGCLAFLNEFDGRLPPLETNLIPEELLQWNGWLRKDGKRPYWIDENGDREYKRFQHKQNQRSLIELLEDSHNLGLYVRDGLCCLDFDGVIDAEGRLTEPIVQKVLSTFPTYTSISSSGTGTHVWFWSDDPILQATFKLTFSRDPRSQAFRENKQSSWLGRSHVSYTGIPHPKYANLPIRKLSEEDARELLEIILPHSEPVTPQPLPETSTKREPDAGTEPFGIKWKPSYLPYVRSLMRWDKPLGMRDTSHSGWSQYWLRAYMAGAVSLDMDELINLSHRFEGYWENAPPGIWYHRANHPRSWHEREVRNAVQYAIDTKKVVSLNNGEKQGVTTSEKQLAQAAKHITSSNIKSISKVIFMSIINKANGRDTVRISNGELAEDSGCSRSHVKRSKVEISQKHRCLEINRTLYTLKLDKPCG